MGYGGRHSHTQTHVKPDIKAHIEREREAEGLTTSRSQRRSPAGQLVAVVAVAAFCDVASRGRFRSEG